MESIWEFFKDNAASAAAFAAVSTVLASAVAGIVSALGARWKRGLEARRREIEDSVTTSFTDSAIATGTPWLEKALIRSIASASSPIASSPILESKLDKAEAHRVFGELAERIQEIEKRFPDANTIDKVSSVNEAVLAVYVENLRKTLDKLERDTLTSWDVAKIFFLILAALGVTTGIVFGAITLIGSSQGTPPG